MSIFMGGKSPFLSSDDHDLLSNYATWKAHVSSSRQHRGGALRGEGKIESMSCEFKHTVEIYEGTYLSFTKLSILP